jgi:predicted amidohydrolase
MIKESHMTNLNIALLQMVSAGSDQDTNFVKGEQFCRQAAAMGADIALFPEMWNIGYSVFDPDQPGAFEQWAAQAIGPRDPFIVHFKALARELDMAIALTYLERWDGLPRNTMSLIDRHGEIVLTYAKVHTCDFAPDIDGACTPGDDFYVIALDTAQGHVKIGAMICYDREFPESARILMLKGAEIILTPNACTLDEPRIGQFRARAYENMVGVAMANYAAPQNNGHSVAFDAEAFAETDVTARDTLIVEAGEAEGIFIATFDLDRLRAYRAREIWGNAYRKPRCYDILTALDVQEPFTREDARR